MWKLLKKPKLRFLRDGDSIYEYFSGSSFYYRRVKTHEEQRKQIEKVFSLFREVFILRAVFTFGKWIAVSLGEPEQRRL